MKNIISLNLLLIGLLTFYSCNTANHTKKNFLPAKFKPLNKSLEYAIKEHKVKFEYILEQIKDTAKSSISIQKIADLEAIALYLLSVNNDLEKIKVKVKKNATDKNIEELMLRDSRASYTNILIRALNNTFRKYQQRNLKFFSNPRPWSKRYLDLITPQQKKNPPNFGEFYFKNSNKEEVLITLKILQLSAMQEGLEIQQKIIYEK